MENMTKKMKGMMNLRYSNNCLLSDICPELSQRKDGLGKLSRLGKFFLLTVCLLMASVGAWAQTYVFITNETNGYFIGLSNGNAVATQAFTTGSCVWTASGTLNNNNRTLSIGTSYLDGANSNSGTVSIGNNRNGNWRGNNNQLYYYRNSNRAVYRDGTQVKWNGATNVFRIYTSYTTTAEAFTVANITGINDIVTAKGTYNLVSAASYNPTYYTFTGPDTRYWASGYTTGAVTTRPVKTTGFTSDTWSLNKTIPGLSINSNTGVLTYSSYVTEDTQVTITHTVRENGQTKTATRTITLKGTIETSLSFASTSLNMTATTLRLPAVNLTASNGSTPPGTVTYSSNNTGCISVSNTGVLTINGAGTATITANYAANGAYLASSATMTITVANTAALDETVLGEIAITPSSQTLDLGQQVTYTASDKVNSTHRTRSAYSTISTGGNNYYKVGGNYQATAPTVTEDSTPLDFTQMQWAFSGGNGQYYQPSTTSSQSTTELVLTRNTSKTGTTQTFTITATGLYGGWSGQTKTATATVTIPATQVDLTALHAGEAINLGVGSSESINGHYTYEPDYDAAGAPYLKFKYKSNNESVATVDASGKVTAVGPGQTTITVTAVKLDGTDGVTCNVTVNVAIDAPTISIDGSGNVTITHPVPGVQIRYTTNGTDPTATTGTVYTASFKAGNEQTIKAIAVANGVASAVASQFYATSGVSGSKVILNDYEDHTWTYYAGVDSEVDGGNYNTNYKGKLYRPNPRNVKITYNATNNAAVSIDESATSFVYYKTLEEGATTGQYPYQVISNPFSKRPAHSGTTYYGFAGWKIVSGGQYINGYNDGQTLPLDAEITFVNLPYPSVNCTSAEIVFETTWTTANRTYITTNPGSATTYTFNSGTYETNFVVINVNYTRQITIAGSATIMMVEPDGSANYRGRAFSGALVPAGSPNTTKIEYANWTNTDDINAQGRNLTIGRGVTHSGGTLYGTNTNANINQVFKIESGTYTSFYAIGGSGPDNNMTKQHITFGNDYDRANNNDNSKMRITNGMYLLGKGANTGTDKLIITAKSGSFTPSLTHTTASASGNCFYLSYNSGTQQTNHRTLIIEGGEFWHIAGGYDRTATNDVNLKIRVKGGIIHGCVYGGAAKYRAQGSKQFVFTGGTVEGWIAGGSNGFGATTNTGTTSTSTNSVSGDVQGQSYIYVGGNTIVKSNNETKIDESVGGNVFGAGCGNTSIESSGRVNRGTNVVIADNAEVQRGVYGGGAYGSTPATANLYVTGGLVSCIYDTQNNAFGGVYGGARQKSGADVNIYMTDGTIEGVTRNGNTGGGLYGGSNNDGTLSGSVKMQINGGYVGTESHVANIHGGGYGQTTGVSGNVDITLGKTDAARDADGVTVWGDVYGGSALGKVNGTAATNNYHTNVTLNAGTINGSLYGGGLGQGTTQANVYGPVAVKVYGGSVKTTSVAGSGAVYGCNNVAGAPQRAVTVDIYNTDAHDDKGTLDDYSDDVYAIDAVYGGGNRANYTYGTPAVTVHNCDNSIQYVYGGGNQATVPGTNVTINGGNIIGNVFGGGNNANVTDNGTQVTINGGRILNVYGGNNNGGTIKGAIKVNVAEPANSTCPVDVTDLYGGGNKAASNAGQIIIGKCHNISNVYGGANQANVTGPINLSIVDGNIGKVFGGNNNSGTVTGAINVTVNWKGTGDRSLGSVYGGGNLAPYIGTPTVNIINGTLSGSVFGGGLGKTAIVTGNPQVNIGSWTEGTVDIGGDVFGGGDLAAVEGNPTVVIRDCYTIIRGDLYGGGNAAPVYSTNTTMWGGSVLGNVFGGGNGADPTKNANGAQVGYKSDDTTKAGTGDATTNIYGGTIGVWNGNECTAGGGIFGGSNTNGNIAGHVNLTIDQRKDGTNGCDLKLKELYGAGNQAAYNGQGINFNLGCVDYLEEIYGGAKAADLNGNAVLTIRSGHFKNVFGGNNERGKLNGKIVVNIDETGCNPVIIENLYGGGNQAAYSVYGYEDALNDDNSVKVKTSGSKLYDDPQVNIISCTSIGTVFGGGYGESAVMVGNPTVNINQIKGIHAGTTPNGGNPIPDALGEIGAVFGGGNAAKVIGDTNVNVGTATDQVSHVTGSDQVKASKYNAGANITGNVYGGGNQADVTGKTNVIVGRE